MKPADDKEILLGCLRNEGRSQKALFDKYYSDMLAVCLRYTKDKDEAKDVLQDAFIKIFTKIDTFNRQGTLKAWIQSIMVHTALDHYRSTRRDMKLLEAEMEKDEFEEAEVEGAIEYEEILQLIQKLPDTQRTIFNLYVMEGYSHKEIAVELDTTEGGSKWHLCEARKTLKKLLESNYPVKLKEYA